MTCFHVAIGHLCVFFEENVYLIICPFLRWIASLLLDYELFIHSEYKFPITYMICMIASYRMEVLLY